MPVASPGYGQPRTMAVPVVEALLVLAQSPFATSPPGAKKVTNKAMLWYVPLSLKNVNKVVEVPPIQVGQLVLVTENRS